MNNDFQTQGQKDIRGHSGDMSPQGQRGHTLKGCPNVPVADVAINKTKVCQTCRARKLHAEFAPHNGSADGRRNHCRICMATGRRLVRAETQEQKARRKERQSRPQWQRSHARALTRHEKRFPKAARAVRIALTAFHAGKLQPAEHCQADGCNYSGKLEKHHHDYDQPLSVLWVCPTHHRQGHSRGIIVTAPGIDPALGAIPIRS